MSGSGYKKNGPRSTHKKAPSSQASYQNYQDSEEEVKKRSEARLEACRKERLEYLASEQAKPPPPKPKPSSPQYGLSGGFTQPKTEMTDKIKASLKDLRAKREQDPTFKPSTEKLSELSDYFTKPRSPRSKIVVDQVYDYSGLESSTTPNTVQDIKATAVADGYLSEGFMDDINKFAIRGETHPEALPSSPASLSLANFGTIAGQGQSPRGSEAATSLEPSLPPTKSSTSNAQTEKSLKPTSANLKKLQKKLDNIDKDIENLQQKLTEKQHLRDKTANEVKEMNQTLSSCAENSASTHAKRKLGSPEDETKKASKPCANEKPRKKQVKK